MATTPTTRFETPRPTLGTEGVSTRAATDAVALLVAELQEGWDARDADLTDRRLAHDVVWGSPFGASVKGYPELHAIHRHLKEQGVGGPSSRFEVVQVVVPTADVAVAQVRRLALDPTGEPVDATGDRAGPFSETALYVLARRDGDWWLVAGQNTPIRNPRESGGRRR